MLKTWKENMVSVCVCACALLCSFLCIFSAIAGTHIQLQEKLLDTQTQDKKPNGEFLYSLSGMIGSRWPSFAVCLALKDEEIEELKGKVGLSQQELALQMLRVWASKERSTYGQLRCKLLTISLFLR